MQSLSSFRWFPSSDFARIGLGICYDIRFPELAMIMARKGVTNVTSSWSVVNFLYPGCHVLIYPGAFNPTTGPLHWELLQRGRFVFVGCLLLWRLWTSLEPWTIRCLSLRVVLPETWAQTILQCVQLHHIVELPTWQDNAVRALDGCGPYVSWTVPCLTKSAESTVLLGERSCPKLKKMRKRRSLS